MSEADRSSSPQPPAGMVQDTTAAPIVSIVICTHNRAAHLRRALESVLPQLPEDGSAEIIVVDNRSTDDTAEVVREEAARGRVRYLTEERLGLCNARNAGWRAARGSYVAYLDDDAVALPGWLETIGEVFNAMPAVGVVGGSVIPEWEADRPGWLSDQAALVLAIVDWSTGPKTLQDLDSEWLVGANMAVRRELLERIGGFHPALDRVGSNMLSSGDVYLLKQAVRYGCSCFYHPRMAVRHTVPASRLTKRWFVRRFFWQGISDAVMELIDRSPSVPRRMALAFRRAARLILRRPRWVLALLLPTSDPERFTAKCFGLIEIGHIGGLLGAAKR